MNTLSCRYLDDLERFDDLEIFDDYKAGGEWSEEDSYYCLSCRTNIYTSCRKYCRFCNGDNCPCSPCDN